jgi:hypothetical protein
MWILLERTEAHWSVIQLLLTADLLHPDDGGAMFFETLVLTKTTWRHIPEFGIQYGSSHTQGYEIVYT